jgi:hypothetical protein
MSTVPARRLITAAVGALLALLNEPRTSGLTLELVNGDVPVNEAVAQVLTPAGESEEPPR